MTTPTPRDKDMPPVPSRKTKSAGNKNEGDAEDYEHDEGTKHDEDTNAGEEDLAVKMARREALATILRDDLTTPYLTCQRCNSVTFINVNRVRHRVHDPAKPLSAYEQLPICSGCGTTKYLRAGVVSFQDKIDEEKQKIKEFEKKRFPATHLLVRIARGFLGRLAFRRRKREHELYLWRINLSATRIQTRVRGMQARRRTIYERCLRIIRGMHVSILQFALAARADRAPVFWYENPSELQILYWNYREFVRRSGGKPPLFKVESNLLEITRRMVLREYELVSRIQSRWRGLTTRLVFCEYKRQRGWLRGIQQSPAIKIQRLYRAHSAKRRCNALRAVKAYPDHMAAYREERHTQHKHDQAKAFRKRLLAKYRLTYQTDKTSKMLALHTTSESNNDQEKMMLLSDIHHSLKANPTGSPPRSMQQQKPGMQQEIGVPVVKTHASQHPNARKLAEMKRIVDAKKKHDHRVRGPRLHILHAHEYASREEPGS